MQVNKNVKIAGGFGLFVILWMLSGMFSGDTKLEKKATLETPKVLAKKLEPIKYTPKVEVVGRTEVSQEVDLVSEVSGKVTKINFVQGDSVEKGDLMLELENGHRAKELESAKVDLSSAKLKLSIAKDLAKQSYKTKTDLADREADYARALSMYTDAKRNYENSFVKAPFSGFVDARNVSLADYVSADTVLYTIISQDELLLVGYLSANQISKVKLGQKAIGRFSNGLRAEGEVTFISQKADEVTKTYKMEVTVTRKGEKFRVIEGITVNIAIPTEELNLYKIPHSAMVIADDGEVGVRLVNDKNIVEFKPAKLVNDSHNYQMIYIEGAEGTINLITRGQIDVQAGLNVEVSFSDEQPIEQPKDTSEDKK